MTRERKGPGAFGGKGGRKSGGGRGGRAAPGGGKRAGQRAGQRGDFGGGEGPRGEGRGFGKGARGEFRGRGDRDNDKRGEFRKTGRSTERQSDRKRDDVRRGDGGPERPRFSRNDGRRNEGRRDDKPRGRRPDFREQGRDNNRRREPAVEERAERPVRSPEPDAPLPTAVQTVYVTADEHGMRLDRFFEARFPGLSFSHIQRIVRKGEVRVNGKRAEPKSRIEKGQTVRIPPLKLAAPKPKDNATAEQKDRAFLQDITIYEDDDVLVLNKPAGLAVQGGSGTTRHIDGMLESLKRPGKDAQRPRLVHRLDKDTAGCLLIAKTRFAAAALGESFRARDTRKFYWALVAGVPKPKQGRISTFLAKDERVEDSVMRVAEHGEEEASHAVTYYAVVETAAQKLAWLSLKPVTGRTHQLRVHMAHVGNPIVGDPKYFNIENWEFPGGLQNKLHLLARRIVIPHPRDPARSVIDVSAPLPDHMQQSWNLLGFDTTRYDPIEDAPEE